VIGGAGFVGTVLCRELLARGLAVTVMDALVYGDAGLDELYANDDFDVVRGDIRDIEAVVRAMRDVDAVVHLGGLVGDPACALDEETTLDINMHATATLALVARGLGIKRLVFASSCSIYGASDGILDELSALAPVSVYARSKMESERMLVEMADDDFTPVILRFGTFYGMSPRARFDLVANLLVAKALDDGEITVFGGGQWRPFLHVSDGAEAVIRCLTADADLVRGQVFNVGGDEENHTLAELGAMVADAVPGSRLVLGEAATVEANYRVSFAKIRDVLDFVPSVSLADGIREIRDAVSSGAVGDYSESRYSNIKALTDGGAADVLSRGTSQTRLDSLAAGA
jgi:nucleoside-diphosphate-sugar epimerase